MQDTASHSDRQSFWNHHVQGYRASGLSKAAYCREHDLSYHQMVYWSTKEAEPESDHLAVPSPSVPMLVPVSLSQTSHESDLTIRLPTGVVISGINAGTVGILDSVISAL